MKRTCSIIRIPILFIAVLMLCSNFTPVCFAMMADKPVEQEDISNVQQLLNWYNAPDNGKEASANLSDNIIIDQPIELSPTVGGRVLITQQHTIRITSGGNLTLNNPGIVLLSMTISPSSIVTVESGGELNLINGTIAGRNAILVKSGGKLVENGGVVNGAIKYENLTIPNGGKQIAKIAYEPDIISCYAEEPPSANQYPKSEGAIVQDLDSESLIELPVEWDISKVNFNVAGTYSAQGYFTEDGLKANGVSNPNEITASLTLVVRDKGAVKNVRGELLSIDSNGNAISRLILPILPQDVTALYLFKSYDGENWDKVYWKCPDYTGGYIKNYDFKQNTNTVGANTYLAYHYKTDYRSFWLKVEIVGSINEGITNSVKIITPSNALPGEGVHIPSDEDDGDSGGNRGGGTQGEEDRELPNNESVNIPVESSPTVSEEEQPDQSADKNNPQVNESDNTLHTASDFVKESEPHTQAKNPSVENSTEETVSAPSDTISQTTLEAAADKIPVREVPIPNESEKKTKAIFYTTIGGASIVMVVSVIYFMFFRKP